MGSTNDVKTVFSANTAKKTPGTLFLHRTDPAVDQTSGLFNSRLRRG